MKESSLVRALFVILFLLLMLSPAYSMEVNSIKLVYSSNRDVELTTLRPATKVDAYIVFNLSLDSNESLISLKAYTSEFSDDNFLRKDVVEVNECDQEDNGTCIVYLPIKILKLSHSSVTIVMPYDIATNVTTISNQYSFNLPLDTTRPKVNEVFTDHRVDVGYPIYLFRPGQNLIKLDMDDSVASFNLRNVYLIVNGRQVRASKCEGNLCYFNLPIFCDDFDRVNVLVSPYSKDDAGNLIISKSLNVKFYCDAKSPEILNIYGPTPEKGQHFMQGKSFSFSVEVKDTSNLPLRFLVDMSPLSGSNESEGDCTLLDDSKHIYNCTFSSSLIDSSLSPVDIKFKIYDAAGNFVQNQITLPKVLASEESGFYSDVWKELASATIMPDRVSDEVITRNMRGFLLNLDLSPKKRGWEIWDISNFQCDLMNGNENLKENVAVQMNDFFSDKEKALLFLEIYAPMLEDFEANLRFNCSAEIYSLNPDTGIYLTYPEKVSFKFNLQVFDGIFPSVERAQQEYDALLEKLNGDTSLKGILALQQIVFLARSLCSAKAGLEMVRSLLDSGESSVSFAPPVAEGIKKSRLAISTSQLSISSIIGATCNLFACPTKNEPIRKGSIHKAFFDMFGEGADSQTIEYFFGDPYSNILGAVATFFPKGPLRGCFPALFSVASNVYLSGKCSEINCYSTAISSGIPQGEFCKNVASKAKLQAIIYAFAGGGNIVERMLRKLDLVLSDIVSYALSYILEQHVCKVLPGGASGLCDLPFRLKSLLEQFSTLKSLISNVGDISNTLNNLAALYRGGEGVASLCGADLKKFYEYRDLIDEIYLTPQQYVSSTDFYKNIRVPDESVLNSKYPVNLECAPNTFCSFDPFSQSVIEVHARRTFDSNGIVLSYETVKKLKNGEETRKISWEDLSNINSPLWDALLPNLEGEKRDSVARFLLWEHLSGRFKIGCNKNKGHCNLTISSSDLDNDFIRNYLRDSLKELGFDSDTSTASSISDCLKDTEIRKSASDKSCTITLNYNDVEKIRSAYKEALQKEWEATKWQRTYRTFYFIHSAASAGLSLLDKNDPDNFFTGASSFIHLSLENSGPLGNFFKQLMERFKQLREGGLSSVIYDLPYSEYFETPEAGQVAVITPPTSEGTAGYYFIYGIKTPIYSAENANTINKKFKYFIVAQTSKNLGSSPIGYKICLANDSGNCKKVIKTGEVEEGKTLVEGNAFSAPIFNAELEEDYTKVCIEFNKAPEDYFGKSSSEAELPKKLCSRLVTS